MRNLVFAALVAFAGPLAAQQAQIWGDSAASLDARIQVLRGRLRQIDSDVVVVAQHGDLVMRASPKARDASRAAFAAFDSVRQRWFAGARPDSDGFRIKFRIEKIELAGRGQRVAAGTAMLAGLPDTGHSVRDTRSGTESDLPGQLTTVYAAMLVHAAPPVVGSWTGDLTVLSLPEQLRRERVMYEFVTASGPRQRKCANGSLTDCMAAFALRGSDNNAGLDVYSQSARGDLLLTALEAGGPGAWERFTAAAASQGLAPALGAAARLPEDSVVARWRRDILARLPDNAPITSTSAAIAMLWILGIGGLTLGATRWV